MLVRSVGDVTEVVVAAVWESIDADTHCGSIPAETLEVRDRSAGAGPLLVDINRKSELHGLRHALPEPTARALAPSYLYLVYILSMSLQEGPP